jgi:hypothetical protein
VSGFLSRLAARVVGEAPVARARVPALFESRDSPAAVENDLEVVEEEIARRSQAPVARPRMTPAESVARSTTPEPPPAREPPARPAPEPRAPSPDPAPVAPDPSPEPAELDAQADESSDRRDSVPIGSVPAITQAVHVVRDAPAPLAAEAPRAPVVAAPAIRPSPAARQPAPASRAESPATRPEEEPAVRIHIGRLEVRANVQQPPPRPLPRREDEPVRGLSLSDYLRGKREAG